MNKNLHPLNYINIGERLRQARNRSGKKQAAVCEKLELSAGYLSDLENGKKRPSLEVLYMLSEEYAVPLDFFVQDSRTEEERSGIPEHLPDLEQINENDRHLLWNMAQIILQDQREGKRPNR